MKKLFICLFFLIVFFGLTSSVKAQVYQMDDAVYNKMAYENLDLGFSKLDSYDINNINGSNITPISGEQLLSFTINANNKNAITYEANPNDEKPYLLKLMYKNVTQVGLRSIDVNIYLTKVVLSDFWENGSYYNTDGAGFAYVATDGVWIGSEVSNSPYRYSADQEIYVTTEILWSDDHTVVNLPFLNIQSDIDINYNTSTNKTLEKWRAMSGYVGDYYIFNSSQLVQDGDDSWYSNGPRTDDIDSYIKTGVYAPTVNGKFSSFFHEGVCASNIGISMQTFSSPSKTSSIIGLNNTAKNQVDAIGDKIIYTISQDFGDLYASVFVPYRSFAIIDTIDSNLNYESAQVMIDDGGSSVDITNDSQYGTLLYDDNTKTITYSLNPTWLSSSNNYNGQTFILNITTSLKTVDRNFVNTAYTNLDDIPFPSSQVEDLYVKKPVTYKYISLTDNKDLPNEISTVSGLYKISDDRQYLIGENALRDTNIEIGTTYEVYENGKHVGSWVLTNWNSDVTKMDADGVEFIGYWVYEPKEVKTPTYKYISKTPGKELPSEISVSEGKYKIIDDNEYLLGENVTRSKEVTIGTTYKVYENGKHVGSWVLTGWNCDVDTMDEDGVEFIGYWEYITNPNTNDNIMRYIIVFIVSLFILALCLSPKLFKTNNNDKQ